MDQQRVDDYFAVLGGLPGLTEATDTQGSRLSLADAFGRMITSARRACDAENKLMLIGNGGSAAIASHMAIDYSKTAGLRALCFNDGAALTCLGNDYGYASVFAKQIGMHGRAGDLLIAISSSGRSPNILDAVAVARARGCGVVTFSGFQADNPLRGLGDVNFYVPSGAYGLVEVTHIALIHAILDLTMGWQPENTAAMTGAG